MGRIESANRLAMRMWPGHDLSVRRPFQGQAGGLPDTMIDKTLCELPDGRLVTCWNLHNESGAGVSVLDFGATLCSVKVPDRGGTLDEVTLGHDRLSDYWHGRHYLGPVIGRYANRLAGSVFNLDGQRYNLPSNDGPNTLHGGPEGFDRRQWAGATIDTPDGEGLRLSLQSPHGDQGFPGNLDVSISFVWTEDNRLITDFAATSDRPTPLNLTLHGYWNLSAADGGNGLADHLLELAARSYLPVDRAGIPTGEIAAVEATPFDFRLPRNLGESMQAKQEQPGCEAGYDHCWGIEGAGLRRAAVLYHPQSGRELTIETDQPGIQVYTANHFDSNVSGRGGRLCMRHSAIALETQGFPNAPNQPGFPATILRPGQSWHSRTIYTFRVR